MHGDFASLPCTLRMDGSGMVTPFCPTKVMDGAPEENWERPMPLGYSEEGREGASGIVPFTRYLLCVSHLYMQPYLIFTEILQNRYFLHYTANQKLREGSLPQASE